MSLPPDPPSLTDAEGAALLDVAEAAIRAHLAGQRPAPVDLDPLGPALRAPVGAFVTLHVDGRLNGCIGALESDRPLATEVGRLAVAAAFEDPRLPALRSADLPGLHVEVSVLSPLVPVAAESREQLLGLLRPGVDGLLIEAHGRRAVFLPDVWAQVADGDAFLDRLLAKAGLPIGRWPRGVVARRFTTRAVARPAHGAHSPST